MILSVKFSSFSRLAQSYLTGPSFEQQTESVVLNGSPPQVAPDD